MPVPGAADNGEATARLPRDVGRTRPRAAPTTDPGPLDAAESPKGRRGKPGYPRARRFRHRRRRPDPTPGRTPNRAASAGTGTGTATPTATVPARRRPDPDPTPTGDPEAAPGRHTTRTPGRFRPTSAGPSR